VLEHIWADQRALLVGRWARRSARSRSPWVRYPGRRRQWAVVGMGRSGNAQLARGYHSCPRRVQSDRSFRVSACPTELELGCGFLRPAPHTWVPTYLPTPAICVPTETRCAPNHHSRAAQVSSSWWNAGAPRPHLHQEWAHPGAHPDASAPGMGSPGMGSPRRIRTRTALQLRC
jgi:hypothetical protein